VQRQKLVKLAAIILAVGILFTAHPVFAADGDVAKVEGFIKAVIKVVTGLAGLVATGFFVFGGFIYITSSGNPERLDGAKRTLQFSALGLAIAIGAFVISNIVTDLATGAFGS
jgi:hypothetical protein